MHFSKPLKGELCGNGAVEMDGRPLVEIGKTVQTEDGAKGWVVQETAEEKAIYNWREGNFSQADHDLSILWRNTTTHEDLLVNLKKELQDRGGKIKLSNFKELDAFVTESIDRPENQKILLHDLCRTSGVNLLRAFNTMQQWVRSGQPPLKYFVPYSYHVLRVNTLFHVGLQSGLISTRPTNKVDLEYLYYFPFCNIFTSNDNLHLNLAPLLIREDQYFIKGSELKEDLKNINKYLSEQSEEEKDRFKKSPPILESSFTFQRFKEFYNYPDGWQWKQGASEKLTAEALEMMKKFEKAADGEDIKLKNGDEGTFLRELHMLGKMTHVFVEVVRGS
ncbi:hypothetical protein [Pedobacter sp. P26]|uniref:hypothetical protein n=1 Tax=Pedobacter sp. P26 TaxID=3423956 RepID=UPI003D676876